MMDMMRKLRTAAGLAAVAARPLLELSGLSRKTGAVSFRVKFVCGCGFPLATFCRDARMPIGVGPAFVKFADIDPNDRLAEIEDGGIAFNPDMQVVASVYDYAAGLTVVHLHPVPIHPTVSEESIALAVGLFKAAGWTHPRPIDGEWPARLAEHRNPKCRPAGVGIGDILFGPAPPPDSEPKKKQRKTKKEPKPDGDDKGKTPPGPSSN